MNISVIRNANKKEITIYDARTKQKIGNKLDKDIHPWLSKIIDDTNLY